mgnify:CR=1 FL=1
MGRTQYDNDYNTHPAIPFFLSNKSRLQRIRNRDYNMANMGHLFFPFALVETRKFAS